VVVSSSRGSSTLPRWSAYDTAMAQYLRGEQPKDVPPQLVPLFVPINLSFMKSLTAFDPPAAIRASPAAVDHTRRP